MKKISALALFISVIVLLSVVHAFAGPPTPLLRGEYAVVAARTCVYVTNETFTASNNYILPAPGRIREGHADGLLRLNGDGTGSYSYNLIQYQDINTDVNEIPIGFWTGSCDVSYEGASNGLIDVTFFNCESHCEAGFVIGDDSESGPIYLTLAASQGGEVLIISNTYPLVEDWENTTQEVKGKRICSRTITAIRQSMR